MGSSSSSFASLHRRLAGKHQAPISTPDQPQEPSSSSSAAAADAITTPREYAFPQHRLKRRLQNPDKTPLVLVACGSFSPVTVLHLEMFELAQRHIEKTDFEIVGNYMSPCSDTYGKSSLVPVHHRIEM